MKVKNSFNFHFAEHGFARDISEQDSKNAVDIASTDKDDCGKTSKSSDLVSMHQSIMYTCTPLDVLTFTN